jgi:cytochrome c oxidase subunit III
MFERSPQLPEDARSFQGVVLLLISLGVFFFSSLLLYAIYVLMRVGPEAGAVIPFYLPRGFVFTTIILLAISVLLHLAVAAIRSDLHSDFNRYIILSLILSLVFLGTQSSGIFWMIGQLLQPHPTMINLYGFTMFLVIVHAIHVIGGVAGLIFLVFGIRKQAYDHERHFPVRFCAIYWHFLDLVWIVMLCCFGLAAYVSKG